MRIVTLLSILFLVGSSVALGQEPSGGIIADLVYFDDRYNVPLIELPCYSISNYGPTTAQARNGTSSLGGDWSYWAGILPGMANPDTSVFWVQPNSHLQFWTRATVADQPLRITIRQLYHPDVLVRDWFSPGPNADTWYLVDIPLDSTLRNLPMQGFGIQGYDVPHTRYIDDLKVMSVRLFAGPGPLQPAPMDRIAASQIGYAPGMKKQFSCPVDFPSFQIVRTSDNAVMYSGGAPLGRVQSSVINGTNVWIGDFTSLTTPGRYKIVASGRESYPFNIGTDVFDQPLRVAQRMLYYQRAFTQIVMPYAEGPWVHADAAFLAPPGIVKGWYEAGNYAVTLPPIAQTIFFLLSAFEDFRPMNDTTNIPESNNGIPDILDEARWGVQWVLSMQDTSGGFWTVCCPNDGTDSYWYGTNPPTEGTRPTDLRNYVKMLVGTPSAAKAVAVLAHASVVYREFDGAFADQCLEAATRGWVWLMLHPEITDDNGICAGYITGGDAMLMASQRMWAAAAMLYATGNTQCDSVFQANFVGVDNIPSYSLTHAYAARLYLRCPGGSSTYKATLRSQIQTQAQNAVSAGFAHPFGVAIAYYWGSLNTSMQSSGCFGWKEYLDDHSRTLDLDQSLENLHYIFGRNLLNKCYVTGLIGATNGRVEGFHHWMKAISTTPHMYPGILANGPNSDPSQYDVSYPPITYGYFGDPRYPRDASTPLDGRYTDNDSWSTNELTISWNAVLIYNLYAARAAAKNQLPPPPAPVVRANVKVFLGAAYNSATGLMSNTLRTAGVLANYFAGTAIPANAVDSINLEIRNAQTAAGSSIRMYQPAWLLADGSIRSFSDTTKSYIEFPAPSSNCYIVVRHRNHLAVMSAPINSLSPTIPAPFDFTVSQSAAYGTNPMLQFGTTFALYPGDGNGSGIISAADANGVFGQLNSAGYSSNDINLSGIVTAADANIVFAHLNVSTQVP